MIDVYFNTNEERFVWASDLHATLQLKTKLSIWMPRMIDYGFEENKDFIRRSKFVPSAGTIEKALFDWAMTLEMAKHIAMIQRTPTGKAIRNYLLGLDKKVSEGEFLNDAQITALFDICSVMGFFSVQHFFETEHYEKVFNKYGGVSWWEERTRLFGHTVKDLKAAMNELGHKYHNQRQALLKIDKYELIRIGVTEMFVAMGKSKTYAKNIGNTAKNIAKKIKSEIYDDIGTSIDFKSDEQKLIIIDLKSYASNSNILKKFSKHDKNTPHINSAYNQLNIGLNGDTKSPNNISPHT